MDGGMSKHGTVDRLKVRDSEKITINLGYVDLGHIDLLVQEGFYSNRTDFIRSAIRSKVDGHSEVARKALDRHGFELGIRQLGREELEAVQSAGDMLRIQVLGLVVIGTDVSPALALKTIGSLRILGALQASVEVKAALQGRIH